MIHTRRFLGSFAIAFVLVLTINGQKVKSEQVVAKHLESIGSAEARGGLRSIMAVGDAVVTFIAPKNQPAEGRLVLASAGEKMFFGLRLAGSDYPGETFAYDGSKVKVATIIDNRRSFFGNFVESNAAIMRDSIMGGVLSTSWALGNPALKAKLSYDGSKKIDGREYHVLSYSPKGGGDLDITLYFDKETYRHERTEYRRTSSAAIGRTIDESARQSESRLKVVENFSNFKDINGITMPQVYSVRYSITGANGTTEVEWRYDLREFAFNQQIDERSFGADAN